MANKRTTLYLHGKLYWAKIFGAPRPNFDGDAREWTFEFEPDDESMQELEEHDLGDRVKDKSHKKGYEGRRPSMTLKRNEFKFDGEKNDHIRVVDAAGQPWGNSLLGNETEADVKVTVVDYGPRKKAGIYPVAIRVLDHVEFEREEFAPLPEDDKRRQKAAARKQVQQEDFAKDFADDEPEKEPPFEADPPKRGRKPAEKMKILDELDDDIDL